MLLVLLKVMMDLETRVVGSAGYIDVAAAAAGNEARATAHNCMYPAGVCGSWAVAVSGLQVPACCSVEGYCGSNQQGLWTCKLLLRLKAASPRWHLSSSCSRQQQAAHRGQVS
jgi:hypothetical protein